VVARLRMAMLGEAMLPPHPYPSQGSEVGAAMRPRAQHAPKRFTLATVWAMVLGGMGVFAGMWAPVNLFIAKNPGSLMGGFAPPGTTMPPEFVAMQKRLMEASMPALMATVGLANLATGAAVIWAAYRLMKLEPGARAAYKKCMLALGIYELVALGAGLTVQVRTVNIMQALMEDLFRGGPTPPPAAVVDTMKTMMQFSVIFGLLTTVAWGGVKLYYAFWARSYVDEPEVAVYVDGIGPAPM
jgi:hypothetical protein